jgi:hypothetical protein
MNPEKCPEEAEQVTDTADSLPVALEVAVD